VKVIATADVFTVNFLQTYFASGSDVEVLLVYSKRN